MISTAPLELSRLSGRIVTIIDQTVSKSIAEFQNKAALSINLVIKHITGKISNILSFLVSYTFFGRNTIEDMNKN